MHSFDNIHANTCPSITNTTSNKEIFLQDFRNSETNTSELLEHKKCFLSTTCIVMSLFLSTICIVTSVSGSHNGVLFVASFTINKKSITQDRRDVHIKTGVQRWPDRNVASEWKYRQYSTVQYGTVGNLLGPGAQCGQRRYQVQSHHPHSA